MDLLRKRIASNPTAAYEALERLERDFFRFRALVRELVDALDLTSAEATSAARNVGSDADWNYSELLNRARAALGEGGP